MNNNLREILKDRGISVKGLAEKSGISRTTINTWLNGGIPALDKAYKVAAFLGVSVYDIWPKENDSD